jgi:hypothetical protein
VGYLNGFYRWASGDISRHKPASSEVVKMVIINMRSVGERAVGDIGVEYDIPPPDSQELFPWLLSHVQSKVCAQVKSIKYRDYGADSM